MTVTVYAPPVTPGCQRLRPIPQESTASYLTRLAHAYRQTLPQLLEALTIAVDAQGKGLATLPGSELHPNRAAQVRIAALARIPHAHLARALPRWEPVASTRLARPSSSHALPHITWQRTARHRQPPIAACPACVLHHTRGATSTARIYTPGHQRLCTRHHTWAAGDEHSVILNVAALPELQHAQRTHQRLLRHQGADLARSWAQTITTRWYDHQQHAAPRWRRRATALERANSDLAPVRGSWALLARPVVTYPETVALAQALHHHRVLAVLNGSTSSRPRTHTSFLHHTATQLGLPRLDPSDDDPLRAWIHHHTP
ncbi:TniQ family protein [Kitasatospora purpeofusca]|uniref:TniQ family protein n=1 Tax=Kitasatospora purpeofusca TaxID=67352 RepID=UPI002A5AF4C4|nr:TniQ family protein [Kitasatospora purpeofusca]MDY0816243.1 TniQ family protein [Kitasatospora purpeofusca]